MQVLELPKTIYNQILGANSNMITEPTFQLKLVKQQCLFTKELSNLLNSMIV
jgi:hypothetical protein